MISRPDGAPALRAWLLEDTSRAAAWIDDVLTPEQVTAEYPCIAPTVGALATARYAGRGPRYLKIGQHVYYRRLDCVAFLEQCLVDPSRTRRLRAADGDAFADRRGRRA